MVRAASDALVLVGKVVLVLATLLFLASMGGGMLFAFPVLVPLHWLAATRSGPVGTAGWALLAALSIFEAGWMITYLLVEDGAVGLLVGVVAGAATACAFLRRGADRAGSLAAG